MEPTKNNSRFQRWLLPGFLFQSVLIGGGYATGRELVEFFLVTGPLAGLFSILLATLGFSILVSITFELSRLTRTFDYRTFMKQLLGRFWFLYEIVYVALVILVLAVLGAASGELFTTNFGLSATLGTVALMVLIGLLVFWGTGIIEKVLAGWSFLLYAVYGVMIFAYLSKNGHNLAEVFAGDDLSGPWVGNAAKYVCLSLTAITMILFCTRHMESRRDAFIAGTLAGPICMIPAVLFYLGMAASYPAILDAPVPADYMMRSLAFGGLSIIFYIVVYGTFVETGTAMIHAINERVSHVFVEKSSTMPRWLRPAIALFCLFFAIVLAGRFGIIDLIAKGYFALAYIFFGVFILPLITVGIWRIIKNKDGS